MPIYLWNLLEILKQEFLKNLGHIKFNGTAANVKIHFIWKKECFWNGKFSNWNKLIYISIKLNLCIKSSSIFLTLEVPKKYLRLKRIRTLIRRLFWFKYWNEKFKYLNKIRSSYHRNFHHFCYCLDTNILIVWVNEHMIKSQNDWKMHCELEALRIWNVFKDLNFLVYGTNWN